MIFVPTCTFLLILSIFLSLLVQDQKGLALFDNMLHRNHLQESLH